LTMFVTDPADAATHANPAQAPTSDPAAPTITALPIKRKSTSW